VAKLNSQNLPVDLEVQDTVQKAGHSVFNVLKKLKRNYRPKEERLTMVPLTVQRNGERLQYVWKEGKLQTVRKMPVESYESGEGIWMDLKRVHLSVMSMLFPDPMSVSSDYWEWVSWRLLARFFGTCLNVFGTQSLLMATGLGAKNALTASVAINWMVKDGLGRIARLLIATNYSRKFDTNIKKARFISTLVHTVCMTGEFLTPIFPAYFILLAAISNVGKAVIITAFVSTAPSLSIVFAKRHTVCDITAKTQAQYSVVDSLAIAVAASLTHLCRASSQALFILPLASYAVSSLGSIFGMYKENKSLIFRTLNAHRMMQVVCHWAKHRTAVSPEEVCKLESAMGRFPTEDKNQVNVEMGRIEDMSDRPSELESTLERHRDDAFVISLNRVQLGANRHAKPALLISFQEGAENEDILLAFLAAGYAREKIHQSPVNLRNRHVMAETIRQSRDEAKESLSDFTHSLERVGWKTNDLPIQIGDIHSTSKPL